MEIMANILNEAYGGAKKTRIMYRCNLSFKQLNTYLDLLIEMKLLKLTFAKTETNEDLRQYETTRKGQAFIKAYEDLSYLMVANSKIL